MIVHTASRIDLEGLARQTLSAKATDDDVVRLTAAIRAANPGLAAGPVAPGTVVIVPSDSGQQESATSLSAAALEAQAAQAIQQLLTATDSPPAEVEAATGRWIQQLNRLTTIGPR